MSMKIFIFVLLLFFCILLGSGLQAKEETASSRNLRKKGEEYDVLVVSGGGTGCSNLLAKLGRVKRQNEKGELSKMILNHLANEDRLKHSYPDRFKDMKINAGIIYVTGNLTLAVKSLVRRHFTHVQVGVLRGDREWVVNQRYTTPGSEELKTLFLHKPKEEKRIDNEVSSFLNLNAIRLQRILAVAGNTDNDPIGLVKHFKAWVEFASTPRSYPILFLNLNRLKPNTTDIKVLANFINATELKESSFEYKPHRRKGVDLLEASMNVSSNSVKSSTSTNYVTLENVKKGLSYYQQQTLIQDQMHGKIL